MLRMLSLVMLLLLTVGCASQYPNQNPLGKVFPSVSGQSLEKQLIDMPAHFADRQVLILLGYVQDSQFDIDRWLIGLDMTQTQVDVYELPTIAGMFPRMFKTQIDNGMRKGIPKELWKGVITIYADGDKVQQFTGNTNPNNARVMLLDEQSKIIYFYDEGFSVSALNKVRELIK
ncbi:hypothetical protein FLL45_04865 [Aliikangiella marina]|uniref:Lipoprotein n=1 Tax=Aliikangiella marina TaxID=1712262 RepID=A0A545TJ69_9GAMM|nr:hypothetical protein [Aliikangiella marina]TQV77280.1 hypothetical protein FLL45_04865 [Aliikangiella marina]